MRREDKSGILLEKNGRNKDKLFRVHIYRLEEIYSELWHHKHDLENGPHWQMIHFPDIESEYRDGDLPYHSAFLFNYNHAIIERQGKCAIKLRESY